FGLALPVQRITALQAAHSWSQLFQEKGVSEPDLSSRYITAHVLGAKTFESVKAETLSEPLCPEKTLQIWKLCAKRLKRMPVQYVIEEWDFRDLTLKMRPPVFIPRPETEELVDIVLSDLQKESGSLSILEVGCGSGAISLSLLKSFPQLRAVALDQSEDAVHLTKENALRYIKIYIFKILYLSNMVYLGSVSMLNLNVHSAHMCVSCFQAVIHVLCECISFEDPAALDGGADGLTVIKQVLILASQILLNHGRVYLEVDPRQPPLIQQWVESHLQALCYVETKQDFNNRFVLSQMLMS
uniref:Uncharacterized protein n=1 Tax=Periophthalmus magnuspinnatus TaxID=409849 RepID=A0A3B3ZPI4_9GOBI